MNFPMKLLWQIHLTCFFLLCFNFSATNASYSLIFSKGNKTMVSSRGNFECGIFEGSITSPNNKSGFYFGIWYANFPKRKVWVANRRTPLSDDTGTLQVSDSTFSLLDSFNHNVWSVGLLVNRKNSLPIVVELLNNGNLVVRYSKKNDRISDEFLWQSFDHPTDTLLPGMKLDSNSRLVSWEGLNNPFQGIYTYDVRFEKANEKQYEGYIQISGRRIVRIDSNPKYWEMFNTSFDNQEKISLGVNNNGFLRLRVDGVLEWAEWSPKDNKFKVSWMIPKDKCDMYKECGLNSFCTMRSKKPYCQCIEGFKDTSSNLKKGCRRKLKLRCGKDEFRKLMRMKLPYNDLIVDIVNKTSISEEKCRQKCLDDCECSSFAYTYRGCIMWRGDLEDIRNYNTEEGQDFYVRLGTHDDDDDNDNQRTLSIALPIGVCLLFCLIAYLIWKYRWTTSIEVDVPRIQEPPVPVTQQWAYSVMNLQDISTATNGFSDSNKIGEGGFGTVYKGQLSNGQDVAVKRLLNMSPQGVEGFDNEINLIGVVQHMNIIRLLGVFSDEKQKILVYEFLENSSLDTYLFDTTRSSMLDWEARFEIINGIARGLVYLHQDSRFKIIHLDLKPSNILLDKDMIPKISDFGMAKILTRDSEEGKAAVVAGTFGYMAPEYVEDSLYSVKSDVFSFGVLLLEIISGQKNSDFSEQNSDAYLLSFIWKNWKEGKGLDIVDPVIAVLSSSQPNQILRCIQIGLLCVQKLAESRPLMSSVMLMLGSNLENIDYPQEPYKDVSSSREHGSSSSITKTESDIISYKATCSRTR